jgi:hypothetical protein
MIPTLAQPLRSSIEPDGDGLAVTLRADPGSDGAAFEGTLRDPSRFREGMIAFLEALGGSPLPCGPIVSASADAVVWEGFAADESAYALLSVDRSLFAEVSGVQFGTSSVELSWTLAKDFRGLRSYRPTRLVIGPGDPGVGENPAGPPLGWLRASLRLQAALALPGRRIALAREGLYDLLASPGRPAGLRIERAAAGAVSAVREPLGRRIARLGTAEGGPGGWSIGVRGVRRLASLAGLLPLVDEVELTLLGDGLPSVWSARMGGVRLVLGLSGWTAGDGLSAGGASLGRLDPPAEPGRYLAGRVLASFRDHTSQTLAEVVERSGGGEAETVAALYRLAGSGRLAHDRPLGLYRLRPWMPSGSPIDRPPSDDPEAVAAREIARTRSVRVTLDQVSPDGPRLIEGEVLGRPASLRLDAQGRLTRGRCSCSHRSPGGSRLHPCRHLRALVEAATAPTQVPASLDAWLARLRG